MATIQSRYLIKKGYNADYDSKILQNKNPLDNNTFITLTLILFFTRSLVS